MAADSTALSPDRLHYGSSPYRSRDRLVTALVSVTTLGAWIGIVYLAIKGTR